MKPARNAEEGTLPQGCGSLGEGPGSGQGCKGGGVREEVVVRKDVLMDCRKVERTKEWQNVDSRELRPP